MSIKTNIIDFANEVAKKDGVAIAQTSDDKTIIVLDRNFIDKILSQPKHSDFIYIFVEQKTFKD